MMKNITNKSDLPYEPSTIENVDMAVYNWVNDILNLHTETSKGWKKTPVIWVTGERSWQIKNNRDLRDSSNNFILPVITVERTEISKDPTKKGKYWGDVRPFNDEKGGSIAIQSIIKQDKTSNFANADSKRITGQPNFKRENKKIIYETKFVPMVVYATMTYVIDIKTEYQQQMNDLVQPFITLPGTVNYLILKNNGHRYEAFIEPSYSQKNNVNDLQQNERLFNTQITIKVLAHLVGKGRNDDRPKISVRENIVEIKFPKEHIILSENQFVYPPPQPKKWIQTQKLLASDSEAGDAFGGPELFFPLKETALSSDGRILAVAASGEDPAGLTKAGSVYIFVSGSGGYQEVQKLTASFGTDGLPEVSPQGDRFGNSLSISSTGETLVVGSFRDDENDTGAAYVFQSGSAGYQQIQKLTASFGTDGLPKVDPTNDWFGVSVTISSNGEIIAVGAHLDEEASTGGGAAGSVYIFASGSGGYQQVQKLTASFDTNGLPEVPSSRTFGRHTAFSLTGEILAVGAYFDQENNGAVAGAVYIFTSGSGGYQQIQKLTASLGTDGLPEVSPEGDQFGTFVTLSQTGETLAVGAWNDEENNGAYAGAAYIFASGSGGYQQVQKLTASNSISPPGDFFGVPVLLSANGEKLFIASTGDEDNGFDSGAVYVFQSGSNGYQQVDKLIASGDAEPSNDWFGGSLVCTTDGNTLIVGAGFDEEGGGGNSYDGAGSVYVFRYTDDY